MQSNEQNHPTRKQFKGKTGSALANYPLPKYKNQQIRFCSCLLLLPLYSQAVGSVTHSGLFCPNPAVSHTACNLNGNWRISSPRFSFEAGRTSNVPLCKWGLLWWQQRCAGSDVSLIPSASLASNEFHTGKFHALTLNNSSWDFQRIRDRSPIPSHSNRKPLRFGLFSF